MSSKPVTTYWPRASIDSPASPGMLASTATIRPWAIATSRIALSLREGSMTRAPLTIKSYFAALAESTFGRRTNIAAPVAAPTNLRRFIIFQSLQKGKCLVYSSRTNAGTAPQLFRRQGCSLGKRLELRPGDLGVNTEAHATVRARDDVLAAG